MSNYFALFYVGGIPFFGLFMRLRYKRKKNKWRDTSSKKKRVDKEMVKKIMKDAKNHRLARKISEDS